MPDPSGNTTLVAWAGTTLVAGLAAIGAAVGWGRASSRLDEHQRRLDGHSEIMDELRREASATRADIAGIRAGINAINERLE